MLSTSFYFSSLKKIENNTKLYQICNGINKVYSNSYIVCYPFANRIQMKDIIRGISVSKYHSLCWNDRGKLYSWGLKSFGLGYN